ncbi:MAG: GTPase [archaeon]
MPINASPHFERAQAEYEQAQTTEQKIRCLKKMITLAPSHKGAENLRAQLKRRLARLKYTKEKETKSGKSTFKGIKKEDHQVVILGKTNSGKSTLLSLLTNAKPTISEIQFSTTQPIIGMSNIESINMQLIENPAIGSEYYSKGLTNSADALILLINSIEELKEFELYLDKATKKQIIVYNNKKNLSTNELRKLEATMKSKKMNYVVINLKKVSSAWQDNFSSGGWGFSGDMGKKIPGLGTENLQEIKNKLFQTFDKIRVYTKQPGKEKEKRPMILKQGSTIKDVAEKILKGFSKNIKETKIWGPSSKFPGQKIGLKHKIKDLDIVEFKTR